MMNSSEPIFKTSEGWVEYDRRIKLLHGMPTEGQRTGILRDVQEWEKFSLVGIQQEREYNEIMRINELYDKLINEAY